MRLDERDAQDRLRHWLAQQLGAGKITVTDFSRLSGGAIQENWQLNVDVSDGAFAGEQHWVLRTDALSSLSVSHSRGTEFAILQAVSAQGVLAPRPLFYCADKAVLGRAFFLMNRADGIAQGHKLTRLGLSRGAAEALGRQLGQQMACLHRLGPETKALGVLGPPPEHPARHQIAVMRDGLDRLAASAPVLEYGLNWLEDRADHMNPQGCSVLCHRDFRTGNFLVKDGQMTALLDWEFTGWSDRHEDIGWLCARCWRFAAPELTVGGMARFSDFRAAYETESGIDIDLFALSLWQVMAEIRWAVIALQQAARNDSGEELSLELSLSGQMVPEMEYHMLTLIDEIDRGCWRDDRK